MSVLDGAHEYHNDNNDLDDNFMMMMIMMMILAIIIIYKCILPAIDFATGYSTRSSDLLSTLCEPYLESKTLLPGPVVII